MRLRTKMLVVISTVFAVIALYLVSSRFPRQPVIVKLWDGEMRLIQTDSGRNLCYDGAAWQRALFRFAGVRLRFGNTPEVIKAAYTNGTALLFRHDVAFNAAGTQHIWNGSGTMCYVSSNGVESMAQLHAVRFNLDKTNQNIIGEELWFEIPLTREHELHMRLYETNGLNGVVSTNDFRTLNPSS